MGEKREGSWEEEKEEGWKVERGQRGGRKEEIEKEEEKHARQGMGKKRGGRKGEQGRGRDGRKEEAREDSGNGKGGREKTWRCGEWEEEGRRGGRGVGAEEESETIRGEGGRRTGSEHGRRDRWDDGVRKEEREEEKQLRDDGEEKEAPGPPWGGERISASDNLLLSSQVKPQDLHGFSWPRSPGDRRAPATGVCGFCPGVLATRFGRVLLWA